MSECQLRLYLNRFQNVSATMAERLSAATGGAVPPEAWLWPERYNQINAPSQTPSQTRQENEE